jgi:hypothetical protein
VRSKKPCRLQYTCVLSGKKNPSISMLAAIKKLFKNKACMYSWLCAIKMMLIWNSQNGFPGSRAHLQSKDVKMELRLRAEKAPFGPPKLNFILWREDFYESSNFPVKCSFIKLDELSNVMQNGTITSSLLSSLKWYHTLFCSLRSTTTCG